MQASRNPALCLVRTRLSWPPSAQSPFARSGRYPCRGGLKAAWRGVTPSSLLVRAHAPDHPPPRASARALCAGSLQVVASPCCEMALPDVISAILAQVLGPLPRRVLGCACPLLHRGHRSHPTLDGFDARIYPHTATSVGSPISRLQSFDYLRAPTLARPPGCSHRSSANAAGRPGLSHHASPGRLPGPGCGVATCSTRTISMAGLSPAGSRPCRPLPNAPGSCLGFWRRTAARARDAGFGAEVAIGQRGGSSAPR